MASKSIFNRITRHPTPSAVSSAIVGAPASAAAKPPEAEKPKPKMSLKLAGLLVYTVGVKCRGINKKELYAPEHLFSLSENTMNKLLRHGMHDLIKHNRTHLVRTYPKGSRVDSSNYEPHRFWAAGCQLVAVNWQTSGRIFLLRIEPWLIAISVLIDLGCMINRTMFQRNGRSGFVLKPLSLRIQDKELLAKRTKYRLDLRVRFLLTSVLTCG